MSEEEVKRDIEDARKREAVKQKIWEQKQISGSDVPERFIIAPNGRKITESQWMDGEAKIGRNDFRAGA